MTKDKSTEKNTKNKAIFLDRDGVINRYKRTLVKSWSEFKFLPGAKEAIKNFVDNGYLVIVVTNQDVVGWGLISESALKKIHKNMEEELESAGAKITEIFYCPHNPVRKCKCRKPQPGMLIKAEKKYGIDPEQSWMIGDKSTDIQAGSVFGCKTIQIKANLKSKRKIKTNTDNTEPDFVVKNLKEASEIILKDASK